MTGYEDDLPQSPGTPGPNHPSPAGATGNAGPVGTPAPQSDPGYSESATHVTQLPQMPQTTPQSSQSPQASQQPYPGQAPGGQPRPPVQQQPWGQGSAYDTGRGGQHAAPGQTGQQPGPYGGHYGQQSQQPGHLSGQHAAPGQSPFGMPSTSTSAFGPAAVGQLPYPPAYGHQLPPRKRRRGVTALIVAGTIAASAIAGGVAGTVAAHRNASSSAATGAPAASTAVNVPASSQTSNPTAIGAVAKAVLPSVVQVTVQSYNGTSLGSGVILSSDGKILTNNHVIADAANGNGTLTVTFNDGKTAQATIVGYDTGSDLAVIQASGVSGLPAASLGNSDTVQVGDTVVAIGSPDGLQSTVTSGIVSALNRTVTVSSGRGFDASQVTYKAIQTDASINPGNSGGPLLNTSGQVVGINSAIYSPTAGMSQGGSVGLGFSIPVNQVKTMIAKLEAGAQN